MTKLDPFIVDMRGSEMIFDMLQEGFSLHLVCRQLHHMTALLPYKRFDFRFQGMDTMLTWMRCRLVAQREAIRTTWPAEDWLFEVAVGMKDPFFKTSPELKYLGIGYRYQYTRALGQKRDSGSVGQGGEERSPRHPPSLVTISAFKLSVYFRYGTEANTRRRSVNDLSALKQHYISGWFGAQRRNITISSSTHIHIHIHIHTPNAL